MKYINIIQTDIQHNGVSFHSGKGNKNPITPANPAGKVSFLRSGSWKLLKSYFKYLVVWTSKSLPEILWNSSLMTSYGVWCSATCCHQEKCQLLIEKCWKKEKKKENTVFNYNFLRPCQPFLIRGCRSIQPPHLYLHPQLHISVPQT